MPILISNLIGPNTPKYRLCILLVFCLTIIIGLSLNTLGQTLPKEIRGYKVHEAAIRVTISTGPIEKAENSDVAVRLGTPTFVDLSLSGLTLKVEAEVRTARQSGSVELVMFRDFTVNGLAVDIEEYTNKFSVGPKGSSIIPKPIKVHLRTPTVAKAAYRELIGSNKEWTVAGTVFVFGRFRRLGMNFKRILPVKVAFFIPNPIAARLD